MSETTSAQTEPLVTWLRKVQHDLVKYLEMMPRSLDWENLEADDGEILFEAIVETRSAASGCQSALEIWRSAQAALPGGFETAALVADLSDTLERLDQLGRSLEDGELTEETAAAIQALIFEPGLKLKSFRQQLDA